MVVKKRARRVVNKKSNITQIVNVNIHKNKRANKTKPVQAQPIIQQQQVQQQPAAKETQKDVLDAYLSKLNKSFDEQLKQRKEEQKTESKQIESVINNIKPPTQANDNIFDVELDHHGMIYDIARTVGEGAAIAAPYVGKGIMAAAPYVASGIGSAASALGRGVANAAASIYDYATARPPIDPLDQPNLRPTNYDDLYTNQPARYNTTYFDAADYEIPDFTLAGYVKAADEVPVYGAVSADADAAAAEPVDTAVATVIQLKPLSKWSQIEEYYNNQRYADIADYLRKNKPGMSLLTFKRYIKDNMLPNLADVLKISYSSGMSKEAFFNSF